MAKTMQDNNLPPLIAVKSAKFSESESLKKEKELLDKFQSCPSILRCFGDEITTEKGEKLYNILLEYASGGCLVDHIIIKGLPEITVSRCTKSILTALIHIHKAGYVHCDVKPHNVLLVGQDAKLADLGSCCKTSFDGNSSCDDFRGTVMYAAPESIAQQKYLPESDVWALGCSVLHMLTGKSPWAFDSKAQPKAVLFKIGCSGMLPQADTAQEIISKNGFSNGSRCAKSILTALLHIHKAGYVHCDVKPHNVLLVGQDAKLADLGSCCCKTSFVDGNSRCDDFRGTVMYAAPESIAQQKYLPESDVWALGCSVLHMLTGKSPWAFDSKAQPKDVLFKIGCSDQIPQIPTNNKISKEAKDFLAKCLVKDPTARWKVDMLLGHPFVNKADRPTVAGKYHHHHRLSHGIHSLSVYNETPIVMILSNTLVCKTHYEIIGVEEDANQEEIRKIYRTALLNSHPDKLQKSSEPHVRNNHFLEVQKAWEVLSNPESRALYDNELRKSRLDVMNADDVSLNDNDC
ncbi:mitogen-activated protein kinase kinase kinase 20 [Striga hermonthica]|uniref:Mitogen-activated protein kinase kinase kinase 20 n=1 Tax=Striga hermonthica TaxID=68872 RepID=A0A9N7R478_STRHE|nr:mitogen-activated protein kinase kinase kinase 20 [Striga hermonthica]